jgi:hypothetical protein
VASLMQESSCSSSTAVSSAFSWAVQLSSEHLRLGAPHLVGVDIASEGDHGVLAELVLRSATPACAEDQQLAISRRQ